MSNSKGQWSYVVSDRRIGWSVLSLCQIAPVRWRMRCGTGAATPAMVRPPWRSRSSWVLRVLFDRFDDLPQWLEEALSRTGFLSLAGRAQQVDTGVGERGFELAAVVVLVGHQRLCGMGGEQVRVGVEHPEQNVALVGLGA